MERRSSELLLLFLYALGAAIAVKEKQVISIVGNTAELSCVYAPVEKFILNNLRIFWQTTNKSCSVVHTFNSGYENESPQCVDFKNRTRLFQDKLENGIFSLLLLNVSLRDEKTYQCIVQKKDTVFRVIHYANVVLKVAANNSQPVLHGPIGTSPNIGEEVTFSCNYSQGYPKPKVYWINRTDNSSLHPSQLKIVQDSDGTYSVFSTLKIKATPDMTIGCIIENELLQQNLTDFYSLDIINFTSTKSSLLALNEPGAKAGSVIAVVILLVGLVVLIFWLHKRKSSQQKSYADVQQNEEGAQYNTPI
ncbi:ICOS ligand [Emydura macquarii macquarii]|uniref:ICOS ligand n=1 Tax=Emydura macquarii macquarii TaxID=1129001 RepID=UPI00352AE4D8